MSVIEDVRCGSEADAILGPQSTVGSGRYDISFLGRKRSVAEARSLSKSRTMKKIILYCLAALFATLLSSLVPREVNAVIPGSEDCQAGCAFVAAGWPLAYLVDHHGISPRGSVSLVGGFIGVDHIRKSDFLLTFLFWLSVSVCVHAGMKRWQTRA